MGASGAAWSSASGPDGSPVQYSRGVVAAQTEQGGVCERTIAHDVSTWEGDALPVTKLRTQFERWRQACGWNFPASSGPESAIPASGDKLQNRIEDLAGSCQVQGSSVLLWRWRLRVVVSTNPVTVDQSIPIDDPYVQGMAKRTEDGTEYGEAIGRYGEVTIDESGQFGPTGTAWFLTLGPFTGKGNVDPQCDDALISGLGDEYTAFDFYGHMLGTNAAESVDVFLRANGEICPKTCKI